MFPFYYPTTIMLLDDDPLFLESLALRFACEPLICTYTDPDAAIAHLLSSQAAQPSFSEFVAPHDNDLGQSDHNGDRLLKFKWHELQGLMMRCERFAHVSILIVDYDMPAMNGLQVCRALINQPVRKILLTGKAGVDTGVRALNDGLIDGYYAKQDSDLTRDLREGIHRHRQAFFADITKPLSAAIAMDEMGFLLDPAFEEIFTQIGKAVGSVEHYASVEPPGVVLVAADGALTHVLVSTEANLSAQAEMAQDAGAPEELVSLLKSGRVLGAFPRDGFFTVDHAADWQRYIAPTRQVIGTRTWLYALAPDLPHLPRFAPGMTSFDRYLDGHNTSGNGRK